jgi:hypothetical protein
MQEASGHEGERAEMVEIDAGHGRRDGRYDISDPQIQSDVLRRVVPFRKKEPRRSGGAPRLQQR